MNNKVNQDQAVLRMRQLMTYGLNESKAPAYNSVEYTKTGADGNMYGIVREGTNFYIKMAKNASGAITPSNFDYIGGFRERKANMFESFAMAQKYLGEKLQTINESVDDASKRIIAEAWDLNAKKEVNEQRTMQMQTEIARMRQIMNNVVNIHEGKAQTIKPVKANDNTAGTEAGNDMEGVKVDQIKVAQPDPKNPNKPFTVKADIPLKEGTETPLTSRENPDYMDMSNGTEIGSQAPYEVEVEEPENAITEALDDVDGAEDVDSVDADVEGAEPEGDDIDLDAEEDGDVDLEDEGEPIDTDLEDDEIEIDMEDDDIASQLATLQDTLNTIMSKLDAMEYDDDEELYDDEEIEAEDGEDDDFDEESDDFADEEDDFDAEGDDFDDEDEDEDVEIVESKSYKRMKLMEDEQYFGKHPAYGKEAMTHTSTANIMKDGQYDMNDDSVDSEKPYGQSKGNQAPYTISPEAIENAVVEEVKKLLKKKLK